MRKTPLTREAIIEREFKKQWRTRHGNRKLEVKAFEAPAAEAWVVIANGQAWVAMQDSDDFVFWGPQAQRRAGPIEFTIPEDWK